MRVMIKQKKKDGFHPLQRLSRIWHDRLTGAAAGTAVTLATLWVVLVSAAAAAVILRA